MLELAILCLCAYLVGSVPTAYIIGKAARGIDIREHGSGNVGGSNVYYTVGRGWLVPLGLFEIFGKGASPIWLGIYALGWPPDSMLLLAPPLLAVAGHNWSVFLKLQGGRGIVVLSGGLLAFSPLLLAIFILVAMAGWAVTRSSAVWTLISLALLPLWAIIIGEPTVVSWYCGGLLLLVVAKRLAANGEPPVSGLPRRRVFFNRLFRDRDVDSRAEWMARAPRSAKNLRT